MEPEISSDNQVKEVPLRVIFDETVPKPQTLRLLISVAIYYALVQVLFYFESPIYLWVISFVVVGIFNIIVWGALRDYQFSRFKKAQHIKQISQDNVYFYKCLKTIYGARFRSLFKTEQMLIDERNYDSNNSHQEEHETVGGDKAGGDIDNHQEANEANNSSSNDSGNIANPPKEEPVPEPEV